MASFFTAETPVLRFPLPRDRAARLRWLLWPVFAWQVVAPHPRPRRLNVLQKAVLGLCRARNLSFEQIAAKLLVEPVLVAFIADELRGAGWLDSRAAVTSAGLQVLADEECEPVEAQTVGTVFSDAFTGEVWPRFIVDDLPLVDTERDDRGFQRMLSGTPGNPHHDDAFTLTPRHGEQIARRPDPAAVIRASRAHRRQFVWNDDSAAPNAPSVSAVSFVSDQPSAYFVAVRVWRADAGEPHVDDPFGIGESPRLLRQIKALLDTFKGLRDRLHPIFGGNPDSNDPDELHREAAWEIERRLTTSVHHYSAVSEDYTAMQRALLEATRFSRAPDKWHDVAVKAQIACESVLLEIRDRWPPQTVLTHDSPRLNEDLLAQIAQDLGFLPLPETLRTVRSGKIHAALRGGGGLRPLVLALLLGAPGCPDHPLVQAARRAPDLLDRLDALARVRDTVGHATNRRPRTGLDRDDLRKAIERGVETTFTLACLLLNLAGE